MKYFVSKVFYEAKIGTHLKSGPGRHDFPRHLVLIPANERELPLLKRELELEAEAAASDGTFTPIFEELQLLQILQWQIFDKEKCSI